MKPFDYFSPKSLNEACSLLRDSGEGARILAGGTDVLIELRRPSAHSPKSIIDISRIVALKGIRESGDSIVIGSLATHDEVYRSELIARYAPLLKSAVSTIGSPQIRNRGTVGGNIMNAAECADTVPPLMALNAHLTLKSASGEREIALSDFFLKPYVTVARRDEILSAIHFRKLSPDMQSSFVKLGRRNVLSIARLSVAVVLKIAGNGVIEEARIVPGATFPSWHRVQEAEDMIVGQKPSRNIFAEAGKKVSEMMISYTGRRWSTEYKEPVIAVLVRRALEQCVGKEKKA
jgi:CO/xanthine dehydrogenase FAD-binding subunit